jgi:hypothetical protein
MTKRLRAWWRRGTWGVRIAGPVASLIFAGLGPHALAAQDPVDLADLKAWLAEGVAPEDILERARTRCVTSAFAPADLKQLGPAPTALLTQLRRACFRGSQLVVNGGARGLPVLVDGDPVGATPTTLRVTPGRHEVAVGRGAQQRTVPVTVRARQEITATIETVRDTVPWPTVRSADQAVLDLGLRAGAPPPPQFPVPPGSAPSGRSTWRWLMVLGGGAAGGALAMTACNPMYTADGPGLVDGTYIAPGQQYQLGIAPGCVAAYAGGSVVGGWLVGSLFDGLGNRGRRNAYANRVAQFRSDSLAVVQRREQLEDELRSDRRVDSLRKLDARNLERTKAGNVEIRARNAMLPAPQIATTAWAGEDGTLAVASPRVTRTRGRDAELPVSGFADPFATTLLTDPVDLEVPATALRNPKAVAVVIGNGTAGNGRPHAVNDALAVRRYLIGALGVPDANVLLETNASANSLLRLFGVAGSARGQIAQRLAADRSSDLVIFLAGKLATSTAQRPYFVTSDAGVATGGLGYSLEALLESVAALPARSITVVLDVPLGAINLSTALLQVPGATLLLGTGGDLAAEHRHSAFSFGLLQVLQRTLARRSILAPTGTELAEQMNAAASTTVVRVVGAGAGQPLSLFTPTP